MGNFGDNEATVDFVQHVYISYHRLFQKVTLKLALLIANIFVCWHPASERIVGLVFKNDNVFLVIPLRREIRPDERNKIFCQRNQGYRLRIWQLHTFSGFELL